MKIIPKKERKDAWGTVVAAAHQLRQPLAGVRLSLHMLADGNYGALTTDQKEAVIKLIKQTESLIAFANTLLGASSLEHGFVYHFAPLSVEELVNEVAHTHLELLRRRRIIFSLDLPPELLPEVPADKIMLRQAVKNLFDNAIRYTPEGGSITSSIEASRGTIVISVKDSGIGIPRSEQKRIFEKMYRASNARQWEKNGSGLGLFIAKQIALDHGGNVWFDSQEGRGSTFYLSLPIK